MNSTTNLTSADIRCLKEFDHKFFAFPKSDEGREACGKLVKRGLMESMLCAEAVTYRTNDLGRAEVKRAGGTK